MINYFPNFVIFKVFELPSLFPLVCTPENLWYMPLTKSFTFTESYLAPFHKGNQRQIPFGHFAHFVFSERGCYVVQS